MAKRKIAIIDLDNCTVQGAQRSISSLKAPDHLLSERLIEYIKNANPAFDGFYVCTHRCYLNDGQIIERDLKHAEQVRDSFTAVLKYYEEKKMDKDKDPLNLLKESADLRHIDMEYDFVTRIIPNFQRAVGFENKECFAVSTPDDKDHECGSGFTNILKPYEEAVLATKKIISPYTWGISTKGSKTHFNFKPHCEFKQEPQTEIDFNTKNSQLKQIMQHAKQLFPDDEIELHYFDDSAKIINNALKLKEDPKAIPQGVSLHIYEHDAFEGHKAELDKSIILKGVIKGPDIKENVTASVEEMDTTPDKATPVTLFTAPQDILSLDDDETTADTLFYRILSEQKSFDKTPIVSNIEEFKRSIQACLEQCGPNREYDISSEELSNLIVANTHLKQATSSTASSSQFHHPTLSLNFDYAACIRAINQLKMKFTEKAF